jgi:REP element-mobilizing transposase RayT
MVMVDNPNIFASKYKLKSSRLKNFDYSTPGIYFITTCTYRHNNFFGKIINNQMELSKMGLIVKSELLKTFKIRKNLKLHQYVIMPNHIHLLIEIKYQINNNDFNVETPRRDVSTNPDILIKNQNIHKPEIAIKNWRPNSIGSIVCQFKSVCTKRINPKTIFFAWQPRYHDIIIKNEKQYFTIKNYIKNNVINWEKDKYFNR